MTKKKKLDNLRIDLSKKHVLQNSKHVYINPNNLYSLRDYFKPESLDLIFSRNLINSTKFYNILLKEMLIYCRVGGKIILEFEHNNIISTRKLKKEIKELVGKNYTEFLKKGKIHIAIIKKHIPELNKNDSIDKWTFGIITNGKKNGWVEKQISAIKKQNIPKYEIIVCGNYFNRSEKNFRYIPFREKDELGWITKKKNIICNNSKYENLCVMHDRIVLDKEWFAGMKRYGNYFEALSCPILDENNLRCGDWITRGSTASRIAKLGLLEYEDWDKFGYIDGAFYILKKSVWRKIGWDNKLFWNQGEDVKLSLDWYKKKIIIRLNVFSKCKTLNWRHGKMGKYKVDSKKLGKFSKKIKLKAFIKFHFKKIIS